MLALLALLVLDVSVGAQFPVPWGEPLTLRGAASFCLDFAPARKLWTASGSALNGRGKTCLRLILQGLEEAAAYRYKQGNGTPALCCRPLVCLCPAITARCPQSCGTCTKCNAQKLCVNLKMIPRYDPIIL